MRKNESEIFDKTRNQTFPTKMLEKKIENIGGNRPKNVVDFYFPIQARHQWEVLKVFNLEKKPRQSTDLKEYDFVVPKNFT